MTERAESLMRFRLTVKSLEVTLAPELISRHVHILRDRLSTLRGLDGTPFTLLPPLTRIETGETSPDSDHLLCSGLQFELPCDRIRVVLRCVGDWLERTGQINLFVLEQPPTHLAVIQTDEPEVLAQLLPLGEALLPSHEMYYAKAKGYIDVFGEFTPSVKANLALLRHQVSLSDEASSDLDAQVMGPFKNLAEKYEHFRKALLAYKQEGSLDGDFWKVMNDKAEAMGLPKADAQFLKAERLKVLQAEAAQALFQAETKAEAERQQLREQQQRETRYRQLFEGLLADALESELVVQAESEFRQGLMVHLSASDFRRGQLNHAREFYGLELLQIDALEKFVVDELYLLAHLL